MQLDLGDLARLKVGPPLDPVDESLLSVEVLRAGRPSPLIAAWARAVRSQLDPGMLPLLLTIAARPGASPGASGAVVVPGVLHRYREIAVDPFWPAIVALLEADRARRGRIMARHGVGRMLATLHPRVRWRPPFLDVDVAIGGEGGPGPDPVVPGGGPVTLVPSVFCLDRPRIVAGPSGPSEPGGPGPARLVVYPVLRSVEDAASLWAWRAPLAGRSLAALLGRTRASALEAIAGTCSTTELARRIGVSPATASHHAAALRGGRLVVSRRDGGEIRHRLTALGVALLDPGGTTLPDAVPASAGTTTRPHLSTAG